MMLRKLDIHMQRNELAPRYHSIYRNQFEGWRHRTRYTTCIASMRLGVQTPVPPTKKKKTEKE
jgi:hypothetical protein